MEDGFSGARREGLHRARYNVVMSDALLRKWVETWKSAGKELAEIERRELEQMTDEEAKEAAFDMLTLPLPEGSPEREGSGLVEQQRWFARLRSG